MLNELLTYLFALFVYVLGTNRVAIGEASDYIFFCGTWVIFALFDWLYTKVVYLSTALSDLCFRGPCKYSATITTLLLLLLQSPIHLIASQPGVEPVSC